MWDMAQNSITLFFRGKLFANPSAAYQRLAIGIVVTALVLILLAKLGLPVWVAAVVAGLAGGTLQPFLFKDLRYR